MHVSSTIMLVLLWILFGGIVGLIARAIVPGRQPMGWIATVALGIAGSFVGGLLVNILFRHQLFEMHPTGWLGSITGAVVTLALISAGRSRPRIIR